MATSSAIIRIALYGIAIAILLQQPYTFISNRLRVLGITRGFSSSDNTTTSSPSHFFPLSQLESETVQIQGAAECEDFHYHKESGKLFAACQGTTGRRMEWFPPLGKFGRPPALGKGKGGEVGVGDGVIVVIDPETLKATTLELVDFSYPFITHGIDIFTVPKTTNSPPSIYIHAINHLPSPAYASLSPEARLTFKGHKTESQIEIFHHVLGSTQAKHIRSVKHEMIRTPNDVFSTGPGSFFTSNDHYYREGHLRALEDFGSKRLTGWSEVVHVNAKLSKGGENKLDEATRDVVVKVALPGMHNPNGLGHTPTPGEIIINSAAGGVTYLGHYDTDSDSPTISLDHEIHYETTIDNPSYYTDEYATDQEGGDSSGLVIGGLTLAVPYLESMDPNKSGGIVWYIKRNSATTTSGQDLSSLNKWSPPTPIFHDPNGKHIEMITTAVMVGIDPAKNGGKKQGWLFVTSLMSKAVVARKVDL